ncbi:BESS domain-containing protein [Aphis craccivora]|uniref:BESS domain-containing protein n=1 Tax=Aphis craccivora TaxID=307492 RepID=A0A6G0Y055_APHCR|nr:BESS domain-containing protein [Aphis craccivora]
MVLLPIILAQIILHYFFKKKWRNVRDYYIKWNKDENSTPLVAEKTITSGNFDDDPNESLQGEQTFDENQSPADETQENGQTGSNDSDKQFLLSLLPDYKYPNPSQKLDFRIYFLNFFKNLHQPDNNSSSSLTYDNFYQHSASMYIPPPRQPDINNTYIIFKYIIFTCNPATSIFIVSLSTRPCTSNSILFLTRMPSYVKITYIYYYEIYVVFQK